MGWADEPSSKGTARMIVALLEVSLVAAERLLVYSQVVVVHNGSELLPEVVRLLLGGLRRGGALLRRWPGIKELRRVAGAAEFHVEEADRGVPVVGDADEAEAIQSLQREVAVGLLRSQAAMLHPALIPERVAQCVNGAVETHLRMAGSGTAVWPQPPPKQWERRGRCRC